jgi:hypothetical protein|nr:glycosyltransferase [uncultured Rhodopila sp.]
MLNIVVQRHGAHSETLSLFVELLERNCLIFYPTDDLVVSHEKFISTHYGIRFIKTFAEMISIIESTSHHGSLIFNTASEMTEDWAAPLLKAWHGTEVVYHHERTRFERAGLVQIFAHPFVDPNAYLLPVADVVESLVGRDPTPCHIATVVLPNWTRESHLRNKNLNLLSRYLQSADPAKFRFVMTGMSLNIMNAALAAVANSPRVEVMHQLDLRALASLLRKDRTYVLPLNHPNGRYVREGLTGTIPLAINCGCPLVVSRQVAEIYEIGSWVDEDGLLSELPDDADAYRSRIEMTSVDRTLILKKNKLRFDTLISGV